MLMKHRFFPLAGALAISAANPDAGSPLSVGPHTYASDGLSLWYRVAGVPHGEPVVFLHGGPLEGSQGFARTAGPLLEKHLRMVYLDQRGAGHSARPKDRSGYTMAAIVADIEALRVTLGVSRISLVGHSYGTALALEYAARYPGRVSRLVLISAMPDLIAATNRECSRLALENAPAYARAVSAARDRPGLDCNPFAGFGSSTAAGEYFMRAAGANAGTFATLDAADRLEGIKPGSPGQDVLADPALTYRFVQKVRLTMPVLVLAGANDRLTDPVPALAFARSLPHGRGKIYAGAGHFLYVDAPDRFAHDATDFLAK